MYVFLFVYVLLTPTDHLTEQICLCKYHMHFAGCNITVNDKHTDKRPLLQVTHITHFPKNVTLKLCKQMQSNPQVLTGCDPADSFKHCNNNVKGDC